MLSLFKTYKRLVVFALILLGLSMILYFGRFREAQNHTSQTLFEKKEMSVGPMTGQPDTKSATSGESQSDPALAIQEAIRKNQNNAMTRFELGNTYLQKGQPEQAIEEFSAVVALNPALWEAHFNLGIAYFDLEKIDQAILHYQEALRLQPNEADIHFNLAIAYASTGKTQEAITEYQQALRLNREHLGAHNNLGNLYKRIGNLDLALKEFEEAVKLSPQDVLGNYNLATTQDIMGKWKEAMRYYEIVLKVAEGKPEYKPYTQVAQDRIALFKKRS